MRMSVEQVRIVDVLNDVLLDLKGAADALSLRSTVEGDELAFMISRVLDADVDAVRDAVGRIECLEVQEKSDGL